VAAVEKLDRHTPLRVASVNVHGKTFDDEAVILDLRSGTYFALRGSAVDVWELVERNASRARITAALADRYDGSSAEIARAAETLLDELAEADLIAADSSIEPGDVSLQGEARSPFPAPEIERFTDMQELLLLDPIHEVDETGWPHTSAAT
jgi:hypothetical protein